MKYIIYYVNKKLFQAHAVKYIYKHISCWYIVYINIILSRLHTDLFYIYIHIKQTYII